MTTDRIRSRNEGVQFTIRIISREPGSFAIGRVAPTTVMLFLACINDRNAI